MYYNLQIPKLYIQFSPPESCRCIDLSLKETGMYFNLQMPKLYIQFSPPESCRNIDCYLSRRQVCIIIYRCQSYIYSSLPLSHVEILTVISQGDRYVL